MVGSTAQLRIRQVLEEAAGTPQVVTPPSPSVAPSTSTTAKPKPKLVDTRSRADEQPVGRSFAKPVADPHADRLGGPDPERVADAAEPDRDHGTLTTLQQAQALFTTWSCGDPKPPDKKETYQVACDTAGAFKYLLAPSAVEGTEIKSASAGLPQQSLSGNDWQVDLSFKSTGTSQFAKLTGRIVNLPQAPSCGPPTGCNGAAIVLDGVVESAPFIRRST